MSHTTDLHDILSRVDEHKARLYSILQRHNVSEYYIDEAFDSLRELQNYVANRLTLQYNQEDTYDTNYI